MAKEKDNKTNAMRILEQKGVSFKVNLYECEEFIGAVHVADQLGRNMSPPSKPLLRRGKVVIITFLCCRLPKSLT